MVQGRGQQGGLGEANGLDGEMVRGSPGQFLASACVAGNGQRNSGHPKKNPETMQLERQADGYCNVALMFFINIRATPT